MIIYEVTVNIEKEIYFKFIRWLKDHVEEMLKFPGFIQARILKEEQSEKREQEQLTVQYEIDSRENLDNYFKEFAPKMREEGIRRFKNQFSATRKIFHVEEQVLACLDPNLPNVQYQR